MKGFNTFSINVVVDGCLGIESVDLPSITLQPNPNNGVFLIKGMQSQTRCIITDASGKVVHTLNLHSEEQLVDLSELESGMYIVNFLSGDAGISLKMAIVSK